MLFNSIDFAVFLPIVFLLYWFVFKNNIKFQNLFILAASYVFYGWWDWRFLFLIIFSTFVDFFVGIALSKEDNKVKRKIFLLISIVVNLGFLGVFKYYNFFIDNFITAFSWFGLNLQGGSLNIILPVGISFYTFQTLSYSIDIYKKKLQPTKDFIAFAAFVSFFPQLVAGPIERAKNLLPQFSKNRNFEYHKSVDGMRQILWGLFKKIVIADNCAIYANSIFQNYESLNGSALILGAVFFAFQIYGDFSGYSDIAIGTSRLFGFELMQNFAFPYFSRDIAEFWRRWHISLSSWFKDYLYIPLGGSKGSRAKRIRNTFIIFIVSGFWHGANWTFIIWGALNGLYFLHLLLTKKNRRNLDIAAKGKILPSFKDLASILLTFGLTVFAWIFFRAENLSHALNYIYGIFSPSILSLPDFHDLKGGIFTLVLILILLVIEWFGRENKYAIEKLGLKWNKLLRYVFYFAILLFVFQFSGDRQQFIYFQF